MNSTLSTYNGQDAECGHFTLPMKTDQIVNVKKSTRKEPPYTPLYATESGLWADVI